MTNPQPEPSMEEILASIRRIISEDEEEEAPAASAAKSAPPPVAPRPRVPPVAPKPSLVLDTPARGTFEDDRARAHLNTEDVEMIKKNVAANMADDADAMLEDTTATVASKAFQSLSHSVRVSRGEGRTLEDLVTEMLKPIIKDWLDQNLPQIVEEKVEEEVQRIARRRG